jgi:hypothetical protein
MKWNGPCVILLPNSGPKYHLSSEPTRISWVLCLLAFQRN